MKKRAQISCLVFLIVVMSSAVVSGQAPASSVAGGPFDWQYRGVRPTCSDLGFDYQQPFDPSEFNLASTSDLETEWRAAEDLVNGGGVITPAPVGTVLQELIFYGISLEWDGNASTFTAYCAEDDNAGTAFQVVLFRDASGQPGELLAQRQCALPSSIIDTGVGNFAGATVREYRVPLPGSLLPAGETVWVQIARRVGEDAASGNPCYFLWLNETLPGSYDDLAYQHYLSDPGTNTFDPGDDLTICLDYAAGPQDPADKYGGFECGLEEFDSVQGAP